MFLKVPTTPAILIIVVVPPVLKLCHGLVPRLTELQISGKTTRENILISLTCIIAQYAGKITYGLRIP
jgi:hypothetical protein